MQNSIEDVYKILAEASTESIKPLADFVIEQYEKLDLSENQFTKILGINRRTWDRIKTGQADKIDISILIKISHFLNIDIKNIIQLYVASAKVEEIRELETSKKFSYIVNNFDLKKLKEIKFIDSTVDFLKIEKRIKEYFSLDSIFEYSNIETPILYSKANIKSSDKMLNFWRYIVTYKLKNIVNPYVFNEEKLLNVITKMRVASLDVVNGFPSFIKSLFGCGVTVLVHSYLSKTSIRGGTFIINDKPCIVLTNFRNTYPSLWRTFAHEICHVVNDRDEIAKQGYHLTGEPNIFTDNLKEEIANNFADRMFLTNENYELITNYISNEDAVRKYAFKWNVHPSLIYSIYLTRKNDKKEYEKYSKYLVKSNLTIKNIGVNEPWKQKSIKEGIAQVNKIFSTQLEPIQSN